MNAIGLSVCAALGFMLVGCGGSTAIGEVGVGGSGSNASGGEVTGGTGKGGGGSETAGAAGGTPAGAGASSGPAPDGLPCAVLQMAGQECVAAHSTVRVLVPGYTGSLYRVERRDGQATDIGSINGYADAEAHAQFCSSNGGCVIKVIYDQSPMGNDLTESPPGSAKPTPGKPVDASALKVQIDGREVYAMLFRPGQGYRRVIGNGMAVGDEPETIYMVSSQHDLLNGCCFDYGNAGRRASNDGNGTVEAVYLGQGVIWGSGVGPGPWVMADLENGLFPGWENGQWSNISTNNSVEYDFVTAVLVGDTADKNDGMGRFALFGGDAAAGTLQTMYDGIRPVKPGYVPMQKQGSIILSVAGDNSDGDGGRFYEGAIAKGAASSETVDALQAAIVEAGYGK